MLSVLNRQKTETLSLRVKVQTQSAFEGDCVLSRNTGDFNYIKMIMCFFHLRKNNLFFSCQSSNRENSLPLPCTTFPLNSNSDLLKTKIICQCPDQQSNSCQPNTWWQRDGMRHLKRNTGLWECTTCLVLSNMLDLYTVLLYSNAQKNHFSCMTN